MCVIHAACMITRLYSHTHKEMMFCNCLYLKMFLPVAVSLCGCVSLMQQGKPGVLLPSLCFSCCTTTNAGEKVFMVYLKLYDQHFWGGVDESEVYFVVS